MITILGLKFTYETLGFFALFIASEVLAASPAKSNSLAQLIINAANLLRPLRTEDERINRVRDSLK